MPTPFPGMDPYLERTGLWEEVHAGLIVSLQQFLAPRVRPRYRVAVERRSYLEVIASPEKVLVGRRTGAGHTITLAEVPMPDEVADRYLEIRDAATAEVVTVLEVLSPTNKVDFTGRRQYEHKRLTVLGSATHLIEIDLLRGGDSMPLRTRDPGASLGTYRVVVSRGWQTPVAEVRAFHLPDPVPSFPVPLRPGEPETEVPLNELLHDLYDRAGYDLAVDYESPPPPPPLPPVEIAWMASLLGWKPARPH